MGRIDVLKRDFEGWKVDIHKGGQRHEVMTEDITAAFLELECSIKDADQ